MTEEIPQEEEINKEELTLEDIKQEAADFKNKYLQLLADGQNAQKRLQKERYEISQYAVKNILLEFLHPLDHLENALKFTDQASSEVKHWATGFHMILTQFFDVLANYNVKPIESLGKEFDPHLHDAVEMVVTDKAAPGIIVEENIKGYLLGEKTLRPAKVKVAKAPEISSEESIQKEGDME